MKKGWVLVTGASSGIGEACVSRFAKEGWRVIAAARRRDRLERVVRAAKRAGSPQVVMLVLDVRDRLAMNVLFETHESLLDRVDVLVNNAGLARGLEKIYEGRPDEWDEMIDTNIKGLLSMTRLILPSMVRRGRGHVVNLGSIAGHQVYPHGGVYAATKFAVRALNEAMRMDVLGSGVRVTSVDPGMVETEFSRVRFRGDLERARQTYRGVTPLSATDVAEAVWWSVSRPPHVNVQELILMPTDQASVHHLYRRP